MEHICRVVFSDVKDCFLRVPLNTSKESEFAKMVYGTASTAYFSTVSGKLKDCHNSTATVGLNASYAKQLGICQDEPVTVTFIKSLPKLQSVYSIHRSEDLDALGLSKVSLEEKILQQIKVVWPGQTFPVWLGKNFNFMIKIESLSPPCSVGALCSGTELELRPQNHSYVLKPIEYQQKENIASKIYMEPLEFRACEIPPSFMDNQNDVSAAFSASDWPKSWGETPCDVWCTLSISESSSVVEVLLRVFSGHSRPFQMTSSHRNILLAKSMMTALGLSDNGHRVNVISHGPQVKFPLPIPSLLPKPSAVKRQPALTGALLKLVEDAEASLELALRLTPSSAIFHPSGILHLSHNVIVVGGRGSGKSTLSKEICRRLADSPHFVHVEIISCRSLVGKRADVCGRILGAALDKCFLCEPSILFLDDLDCLAPNVSHLEEATAEGIHNARISELVSELLWQVGGSTGQGAGKVAVLVTALSPLELSTSLISPRGTRFFTTTLHIPYLEMDIREKMLLAMFECFDDNSKDSSEKIIHDIALRTRGFVASDLADLVDKATFDAYGRKAYERSDVKGLKWVTVKGVDASVRDAEVGPHGVTGEDIESALGRTVPISLHGTTFVQWGEEDKAMRVGELWEDVGGLKQARKTVEEAVLWPLKHPKLFKSLPLKPRRGMLLYGPPGTGKTRLVSSLGGHCGLRLINVKGPELLSKYIGASEEAVRNIFKKAHSAQPCVLFFDEFESLAPRRGHDSTGVTDRVVNQLLTQLDGVEEDAGDGMFVIAATTRPDLIDPALLRPGRLDVPVLCPMPDEEDRMSILLKLSSRLSLAQEVDLTQLAKLTSGFTGADLQAVLYSSQLLSLKSGYNQDGHQARKAPFITWEHILQALKNTRPSLSKGEIEKYESRYTSHYSSDGTIATTGQKVSLA